MSVKFTMDTSVFQRKLEEMDRKIKKKAIRRALTKAARILAKDLKTRIKSKDTGNLMESIDFLVKQSREAGAYARIGASSKKKNPLKQALPTRYAHLQEEYKKALESGMEANTERCLLAIIAELDKDFT